MQGKAPVLSEKQDWKGKGHFKADPGTGRAGRGARGIPRGCFDAQSTWGPPAGAVVAGTGAVPSQKVLGEELRGLWMFFTAHGAAPHHQHLLCTFQGHVPCQQRCESKHGAVPRLALPSQVSARAGSVPVPAPAGTQRRGDTSHHDLEHMKNAPGT